MRLCHDSRQKNTSKIHKFSGFLNQRKNHSLGRRMKLLGRFSRRRPDPRDAYFRDKLDGTDAALLTPCFERIGAHARHARGFQPARRQNPSKPLSPSTEPNISAA